MRVPRSTVADIFCCSSVMCLEAALRKEKEENTMLPSSKSFMPRLYDPDSGSNFRYPRYTRFEASRSAVVLFRPVCRAILARENCLFLEVKTTHYVQCPVHGLDSIQLSVWRRF